eukprot:TRINITY_DN4575_c0_g1_i1.p6 TRINITY_DN4575_c0_g1~~TRINITY_DN4575_c0_g1_i1.p6  ORF type:complete len:219 (+),score=1.94 TRINITY_DN4575_c0_g1_i1:430-1086(+)
MYFAFLKVMNLILIHVYIYWVFQAYGFDIHMYIFLGFIYFISIQFNINTKVYTQKKMKKRREIDDQGYLEFRPQKNNTREKQNKNKTKKKKRGKGIFLTRVKWHNYVLNYYYYTSFDCASNSTIIIFEIIIFEKIILLIIILKKNYYMVWLQLQFIVKIFKITFDLLRWVQSTYFQFITNSAILLKKRNLCNLCQNLQGGFCSSYNRQKKKKNQQQQW